MKCLMAVRTTSVSISKRNAGHIDLGIPTEKPHAALRNLANVQER
jgi:hypothetical protein